MKTKQKSLLLAAAKLIENFMQSPDESDLVILEKATELLRNVNKLVEAALELEDTGTKKRAKNKVEESDEQMDLFNALAVNEETGIFVEDEFIPLLDEE